MTRSPPPTSAIVKAQDRERSADETAVRLLAEWRDALIAAKAHAVTSMYTHDALFFGSAAELRRGHREILDYFAVVPKGYVRDVIFSRTRAAHVAPDAIVVASFVDFNLESNGVQELRKWRITWTLVRDRAGPWRIAAHHAGPMGTEKSTSVVQAPTAVSGN